MTESFVDRLNVTVNPTSNLWAGIQYVALIAGDPVKNCLINDHACQITGLLPAKQYIVEGRACVTSDDRVDCNPAILTKSAWTLPSGKNIFYCSY